MKLVARHKRVLVERCLSANFRAASGKPGFTTDIVDPGSSYVATILWQSHGEAVRSAMGFHPLNLGARFLLELAALVAFGLWGWSLATGWMRFVLALAVPVTAAAVWGLFNVPGDRSRSGAAPIPVKGIMRLALELGFFALAALALAETGHAGLGIVLAVAVAIHYAISYDRIAWLIAR